MEIHGIQKYNDVIIFILIYWHENIVSFHIIWYLIVMNSLKTLSKEIEESRKAERSKGGWREKRKRERLNLMPPFIEGSELQGLSQTPDLLLSLLNLVKTT